MRRGIQKLWCDRGGIDMGKKDVFISKVMVGYCVLDCSRKALK